MKLDLHHPVTEVLSPSLRIKDYSMLILSDRILIHIVAIQAKNSEELKEVLKWHSIGNSKHQAFPNTILYPPRPNTGIGMVDFYLSGNLMPAAISIVP
jgi:hypothetical protein